MRSTFVSLFALMLTSTAMPSIVHAAPLKEVIKLSSRQVAAMPEGARFGKWDVACLARGTQFVAGFYTERGQQGYWNSIDGWLKHQRQAGKNVSKYTISRSRAAQACRKVPVTCRPKAKALAISASRGQATEIEVAVDTPCRLPISATVVTAPAHGTISTIPVGFRYLPNSTLATSDQIRYRLSNLSGKSAVNTISITLTAEGTPAPEATPTTPPRGTVGPTPPGPTPTATPTGTPILAVEICANGIDDDANGQTDEAGCVAVNSAVGYHEMGDYVDKVPFGKNHWARTSGDPRADESGDDDVFGQHGGAMANATQWTSDLREKVVISPSAGTNLWVAVNLSVPRPGYYILRPSANGASALSVELTIGSSARTFSLSYSRITGGWLVYVPPGVTQVRAKIMPPSATHIYVDGIGLMEVRRKFDESASLSKPRLLFDSFAPISTGITSRSWLSGYRQRLYGGWGSANLGIDFGTWTEYGSYNIGARSYIEQVLLLATACLDSGNIAYCNKGVEGLMAMARWTPNIGGWGRFEQGRDSYITHSGPNTVLGNGEMLHGFSLIYDFLYDYLTPAQRIQALKTLEEEAHYLYERSLEVVGGDNVDGWWKNDGYVNNWGGIISGMAMAGLVLNHNSPYANRYLARGTEIARFVINSYSPNEGNPFEGIQGYHIYGIKQILNLSRALERRGIENLSAYRNGNLNKWSEFNVYTMLPQRDGTTSFDDYLCENLACDPITNPTLLHLAAFNGDGLALWLWQQMSGSNKPVTWTWTTGGQAGALEFTLINGGQVTTAPISPTELGLPLGRYFERAMAISRSGWGVQDQFFAYRTGTFGSHSHVKNTYVYGDLGNMGIWERDSSNGSESHNQVTIDSVGELSTGSNAQLVSKTTAFLHSDPLDYVRSDNRNGFNLRVNSSGVPTNPVDQADRVFLIRRGAAGQRWMLDYYAVKSSLTGTHQYRQYLQPTLDHATMQAVDPATIDLVGNGEIQHGGNLLNQARADATFRVAVIEPQSPTISSILLPNETAYTISVFMTANGAPARFLNLITAYNAANPPLAIQRINAPTYSGAKIGSRDLAFVRTTGNGAYSYVNGARTLTTDAGAVMVEDSGTLTYLFAADSTTTSYGGITVSSASPLTSALTLAAGGYTLVVGNESEHAVAGTASLTLTGIVAGSYAALINGTAAGVLTSSGSLTFNNLPTNSKTTISLVRN